MLVHDPAVDGSLVPSIVVGKSIFILDIVEEYIFLRFIAHDAKKRRFGFHPMEIFDQSVVGERINKFKSI